MIEILSVGAAEYWTGTTITAWTVGIATVITAWITLYKALSANRLDLARSQIEYLVKPMQDNLEDYRKRIETLEKERFEEKLERGIEKQERSAEKILLEETKKILTIFADCYNILYNWIDENITDRKTPMPELPEKAQAYLKGRKEN
jgi:hypothetical protein